MWSHFGSLVASSSSISSRKLVNLGQGFPDSRPPPFALESLAESASSTLDAMHQYTRTEGMPSLVSVISDRYSHHLGRPISDQKEVAITVGASQALYLSLQSLVREGDEVVVFEPFFDFQFCFVFCDF